VVSGTGSVLRLRLTNSNAAVDAKRWAFAFDSAVNNNALVLATETDGLVQTARVVVDRTGQVGIGSGLTAPAALLDVRGSVTFNENGDAVDFRVEGDTEANLLVTDGSADRVGIGTATPTARIQVVVGDAVVDGTRGVRVSNSTDSALLEVGTSNDSYVGTVTSAAFSLRSNNLARITAAATGAMVFNEDGLDYDWRIEGDTDANLISASLAKSLGAKRTIARVRPALQREEWLFDYRTHFRIDHLFSTQRLAAVELAKHIRNPQGLLVEEIARGRIEVQQVEASAGQALLGRPLREMDLPPRVRIGSIRRGDQLFVPTAGDAVTAGDVVTLFGEPALLSEVVPRFRAESVPEKSASVVIFGGGEYGFSLAQMLEGGRQRVRVLERDAKRCRQLCETLQRTVVIQGDATSVQQLKEEQVGDADFFVAATEDDEDNVMTCLQAKSLGTRYCLSLIHRADYADVVSRSSQQLQIRAAVSPREAALRDLQRYISTESVNTVLTLSGGAEVLEAAIPESGVVSHRKVSEVPWPEGSVLVALLHGSEALVPGPEDRMLPGDTIYALVAAGAKKSFRRLLRF